MDCNPQNLAIGECCESGVYCFTSGIKPAETERTRTMIDEQTITKAVNLLLDAAPGSKVILFGSYARGQADARSDLDFLVVEPEVKNRLAEMVRLRQALQPLLGSSLIPVDVLVVSEEKFDYWRDTPNTVYYSALKEGKVYEQVA